MGLFTKYLDRLSEMKREGIRLAGIALVLLFTIILTVSVTSYVFTWKQDQSVASAPAGAQVANTAAETGFSLGKFLVTDSFGLAAFCIVAGFYIVVFLLFMAFRKSWVEKPLVRFLASLLMEK